MKKKTKQVVGSPVIPEIITQENTNRLKIMLGFMVVIFAIILYAPSINFNYVLDDPMVTVNNNLVNHGIRSIPKILSTDYWYGFGELRPPQYRPLSVVLLAIEWQIWPDQPKFYHFINVLLFALTCYVLFITLCSMFNSTIKSRTKGVKSFSLLFPFVATLLYAAHPIHTEVVNNIKSVDEILCFLSALLSVLMAIQYARKNKPWSLVFSVLLYFAALFSKESGISFLILIPLIIYYVTDITVKRVMVIFAFNLFVTVLFLGLRYFVLKDVPVTVGYNSILTNSLNAAPDLITQKATDFFILFRYVVLLIFPHPLSYDYSFSQIAIQKITDIGPLAGILLYLGMFVFAIKKMKEKSIISFSIFFYLITLFPVSNIAMVIGAPMAERFMFIPSLGYVVILTWLLARLTKTDITKIDKGNPFHFFKTNNRMLGILFIILVLYSVKTFTRSQDWKNNTTLFIHDATISSNSARARFNSGISYLNDLSVNEKDPSLKMKYCDKAIIELERSVKILPSWPRSNQYLGDAYMRKDDVMKAIENYELALRLDIPTNDVVLNNLGFLYGKIGEFNKSLKMSDSAIKLNPSFSHAYNNIAFAYLNLNKHHEAIEACKQAIKYDSLFAKAYMNMGCAYINLNEFDKSRECLNKSASIDPNDFQTVYFMGVSYYNQGDTATANRYFAKSNQMKSGMMR